MEVARFSFLQGQPVPVSDANTGYRESKRKEGTMAKKVAAKAATKKPAKAAAKAPAAKKAAAKKPAKTAAKKK
jgi:hypothetical protein